MELDVLCILQRAGQLLFLSGNLQVTGLRNDQMGLEPSLWVLPKATQHKARALSV